MSAVGMTMVLALTALADPLPPNVPSPLAPRAPSPPAPNVPLPLAPRAPSPPASPATPVTPLPLPGASPPPFPFTPPPAAAALPRYPLKPRKKGGYQYDAPAPWRAIVAEDGQVTFEDRRLARTLRILPIFPADHPPGTVTLERTFKDLLARRRPPPQQPEVYLQPLNPAEKANPEPLTTGERKAQGDITQGLSLAHLDFGDLTTHYLAFVGEDAYRVEKARFLAATFETRLAMATRHRLATLRRGLHRLPRDLAAIWAESSRPAIERRRIICDLYTELAGDKDGDRARALIVSFVRRKMPPESEAAYPPAEIAACNAGLADDHPARFAPYPPTPAR